MHKPIKLKYLVTEVKKGRAYRYVRRGKMRFAIKADPGTAEFAEEYASARRKVEGVRGPLKAAEGSLGWLIESYVASEDFQALATKTQTSYRKELDRLQPIASQPIDDIKRRHINFVRKALNDKPRMARMFTQVCSLLWRWGIRELELECDNPARLMSGKVRSKPYRPWTEEEQAQFEASKPPQWLMTAYMLAKYTGARRGDIAAITDHDRKGGYIRVQGQKTNNEIWVPEHPELTGYLNSLPGAIYLVSNDRGPFKPETISKSLRTHLETHGMAEDLVLHGLRHTAGKALAEAGCTDHEIAAVLGHKTLQMVQHYTKKADQRRLSSAAIVKLTRG